MRREELDLRDLAVLCLGLREYAEAIRTGTSRIVRDTPGTARAEPAEVEARWRYALALLHRLEDLGSPESVLLIARGVRHPVAEHHEST